jgi:ribose-phosphate pyrophosphokinase
VGAGLHRSTEASTEASSGLGSRGPISGRGEPVLFALGDSAVLGEAASRRLGVLLAAHEEREFEDGEHKLRPLQSVRGRDVYVLQNLAGDEHQRADERLVRLLFFVATLKEASAASVTVVAPYLCYARKDRQTKPRDPVTTRYVAQLFEAVGTDRVVTVEAHNVAAFQNAFRCDTEHLDANVLFARHFKAVVGAEPVTVVSPDLGGAKRAEALRERLQSVLGRPVSQGFMEKQRSMGKVSGELFAGDVQGRTVIVPDDLISTGTTMARVARVCRERGARAIHAAATHGLFVGGAPALVHEPSITSIVVTDTVSPIRLNQAELGDRLVVLPVGDLIGESIRRMHLGGSVVDLLEHGI